MEQAFNGERLTDLRDLLGLSQTALAERLGAKQAFVSMIESGSRPMPDSLAADAIEEFALPSTFFSVPTTLRDAAPVTFRKKAAASVRDERRIVKKHQEAARLFARVSEESGYRASRLPDPSDFGGDPVLAAEAIREIDGIPANDPIPNVTRLLERLGVGVLARLELAVAHDKDHVSMSRPADAEERPLVAMVASCPGDMARLSLAHELGHLVFDRNRAKPIPSTRSPEENRAYDFASALLVPDAMMRQNVGESLTLHGYLPLKAKYGVSVAALIMRARRMGLISQDRARSLHIQRSSQGWRRHEPVPVKDEKATLLEQCYARAFPDQSNPHVSEATGIMVSLLDDWLPKTSVTAPVLSIADYSARRGASPSRSSDNTAIQATGEG
jgi:Zn-dependent peptidase ImmA (M78 family)/transcriptional regulator with XRE-family HTH domain